MLAAITALAALSVLVTIHAYLAVWRKVRAGDVHQLPRSETTSLEGISILKPLKGADDELYENLVAFAQLDYPCYEVLFGAEDPDDPALAVARRVQRRHPERRIRVLSGAAWSGLNPKVRVLSHLAPRAEHDWILVSDSNVRPRAGYLRDLMACQRRTGASLVHSVLAGTGARSVGAVLENLHMNSWVVAAVCFADALSHPCVIGKSMLMRRSRLASLGGFGAVRDVLAEDYLIGRMFASAGDGVTLSSHVLPTLSIDRSLDSYLNRHVRWGQLRRRLSLLGFVGELLLNPTPWLVLVALLGPPPLAGVALLAIGAKIASDALLSRLLSGSALPLRHLPWILVKDLSTLLMWAVSALRTSVVWRGNRMRIGAGTRLTSDRQVPTARGVEAGGSPEAGWSNSCNRAAPAISSTMR